MKLSMKKYLALLLSLVLVVSYTSKSKSEAGTEAIPIPSETDEPAQYISGDYKYIILEDGTAEIMKYSGKVNELMIPKTLDGHEVTSIGNEAFYYCTSLTSVTIPDSVTSIGDEAFTECTSLTLIISRDSYAEQYCKDQGLKYIYPDSYDWLNN